MIDTEPPPGGSPIIVIVTSVAFLAPELRSLPIIRWVTLHQLHLSFTGEEDYLTSHVKAGSWHVVIAFPKTLLTTEKFTALHIYLKNLGMTPEFFSGNEEQLYNWAAKLRRESHTMNVGHEVVVYAGSIAHHEGLLKLQQDERVRSRILWRGGSDLNQPVPEGVKKVFFFTELGSSHIISSQAAKKGFQFYEKRNLGQIQEGLELHFQPTLRPQPGPLPGPRVILQTPTPLKAASAKSPWLVTTQEELPTHISGTKEQTWSVLGINPATNKESLKEQLGEQGKEERINLYTPAETTKATQKQGHGDDDPLENVPMVIFLGQVSEPIRSTTQHLLTQRGILCIAIPKWGFNELRSWLGTCTFNWTADTFRFCAGEQWYPPLEKSTMKIEDAKEVEATGETSADLGQTLQLKEVDRVEEKAVDHNLSPTPVFAWQPDMNCKKFALANFDLATTIAQQVRPGEIGWENIILTETGKLLQFKPASMYGAVNTYIHEAKKPQHTGLRRADGKLKAEFLAVIRKHMPRNVTFATQNGNHTSSKSTIPVFAGGVPAATELLSPVLTALANLQQEIAALGAKVVQLESDCTAAQQTNTELKEENARLTEENKVISELHSDNMTLRAQNDKLTELKKLIATIQLP